MYNGRGKISKSAFRNGCEIYRLGLKTKHDWCTFAELWSSYYPKITTSPSVNLTQTSW